jgi:para-nitrobenzyl esterase
MAVNCLWKKGHASEKVVVQTMANRLYWLVLLASLVQFAVASEGDGFVDQKKSYVAFHDLDHGFPADWLSSTEDEGEYLVRRRLSASKKGHEKKTVPLDQISELDLNADDEEPVDMSCPTSDEDDHRKKADKETGPAPFPSSKPIDIAPGQGERAFDKGVYSVLWNQSKLTKDSSLYGRTFPQTPKNVGGSSFGGEEDHLTCVLDRQDSSSDVPGQSFEDDKFVVSSKDSKKEGGEPGDAEYPERMLSMHDFEKYDSKAAAATHNGVILGNVVDNYRSFLGIPYAKAPVGDRRWRAAERSGAWPDQYMYDARRLGNQCMQLDTWSYSYFRSLMVGLHSTTSEDCLNLNVYGPTKARLSKLRQRLPVMFFVHGGMFTTGGNSANIYDPANFVSKADVLVVVPNYRLSIWGFLASKELLGEGEGGGGNYGLSDLLAALQWTHENIVAFGGDATRITIAGHSAGAILIHYMLAALGGPRYIDRKLVYQAILFSGASGTSVERETALPDTTVQPVFDKLVQEAGCDSAADPIACLRGVDPRVLQQIGVKHDWAYQWGPVIDGSLVRGSPIELVERGEYAQVPLLVTDCQDDGTIFTVAWALPDQAAYEGLLKEYFRAADVPRIMDAYPACRFGGSYFRAASALFRDALFTCALDDLAGMAAPFSRDVYYFRFSTPLSVPYIVSSLYLTADYGVFHGSELLFLFQGLPSLTVGQQHAVNTVQRRIASFLEGGLPDDPKYPGENPARRITGRFQIDPVCRTWYAWPRSSEPFEDGYNTKHGCPGDSAQIAKVLAHNL